MDSGVLCKGSFVLGSACGHCSRCTTEGQRIAEQLQDYRKAQMLIVQHFGDGDITLWPADHGKGGLAEVVRRLLAGHRKMNDELSAQEEQVETLDRGRFPQFRRDIDGERKPNAPVFSCCNG